MIAVQLVWRFDLVRDTYFRQDDFSFIARGLENALTWDYLMRTEYGHLVPGPFLIHWGMARLGVYNDVLAHLITIGLQAAAGLALLRLLRLLFGSRPAILVPLAFYLLTPMTVSSLSWWAVVVETLPFQIAVPMALHAHIMYVRTGRYGHALAAVAWTVFGMAFFVKAPFILVIAFLITAGWLGGVRGLWRGWLLYLGVLVAYTAVFFRQLFTSVQLTNDIVQPTLPDLSTAAKFAWVLFSGSLVPSSLGGPWKWLPIGEDYAIGAPPPTALWFCLGLVALLAIASSLYRRRAWLAWLAVIAYFLLADVVPIMIGRIEQLGPDLAGYELRYVSSTAMIIAIFIGMAFIPLADEQHPWLRPLPHPRITASVGGLLAGVFVVGSVWSATTYADRPLGKNVKAYVETGRLALKRAPKDAVIVDGHVPAGVVYGIFFYDYALASRVLGPIAPPGTRWVRQLQGPVQNPLTFDKQGRLRPVDIAGLTLPSPGPCRAVGRKEVRFPLPLALTQGGWTVQIAYLNQGPGRLAVTLGGAAAEAEVGKGFGKSYAIVTGSGRDLRLRALGGSTACVGEIKIGVVQPSPTAVPIPAHPVNPANP